MGLFRNYGWDSYGFNKKTRTKFDENGYDIDGFDKNGFDKDGYNRNEFNKKGKNKKTGTKFDKKGFDKDQYDKNKKHLIEYVTTVASIETNRDPPKLRLDYQSGNVHLQAIAFSGSTVSTKLISGGCFDFGDADTPKYILHISFTDDDEELRAELIKQFTYVVRGTLKKWSVFPSGYSIGAYMETDEVTDENASFWLKRVLDNYILHKTWKSS